MDDLELQVKRLDVESGDILVVRTARTLTRAEADAVDAMVSQLGRRHGVRDVSVIVLDNCSDLTVQRPCASHAPATDTSMRQRPVHRFFGGPTHISDLIAEGTAIVDARDAAASSQTVTIRKAAACGKSEQMIDFLTASPVDTRMQHQVPRVVPIVSR